MGKPSINGPFPMAMLNNQRVYNMFSFLKVIKQQNRSEND